jgi:hypothetical protein
LEVFSPNESATDRVIRAVLSVVLLAVGWFFTGGVLRIVLLVVGAIALFSAVTGFCHIYRVLGLSTKRG